MRAHNHLPQQMLISSISTAIGGRPSTGYNTASGFSSPSPQIGSQEMTVSNLHSAPDYNALLQHFYITHNLAYFAPRVSKRVVCAAYNNCRYHGEVIKGKREGLGLAQFHTGLTLFGEWKDDQPHGECMIIFPVGYVMRATLHQGMLQGHSLITSSNKSLFLQTFQQGVLAGCHTVLKKDGSVQMLQFQDGAFHKTIKSKVLDSQEEALVKDQIYNKLFKLDQKLVHQIASVSEMSIHTKRSDTSKRVDAKIGTFVLEDQGLFFGVLDAHTPKGLGIYIGLNDKIKIGSVDDENFMGSCRVIDNQQGVVVEANCKIGDFVGKSRF
jgi:hypothetical protein